MKQLAKPLQVAVLRPMIARSIPPDQRTDYLKWLRFYLDFCLSDTWGHTLSDLIRVHLR